MAAVVTPKEGVPSTRRSLLPGCQPPPWSGVTKKGTTPTSTAWPLTEKGPSEASVRGGVDLVAVGLVSQGTREALRDSQDSVWGRWHVGEGALKAGRENQG